MVTWPDSANLRSAAARPDPTAPVMRTTLFMIIFVPNRPGYLPAWLQSSMPLVGNRTDYTKKSNWAPLLAASSRSGSIHTRAQHSQLGSQSGDGRGIAAFLAKVHHLVLLVRQLAAQAVEAGCRPSALEKREGHGPW
jgi:hypothetical protein